MKNDQEQLEALQDIRKMMKESSKFLSLSGLSGIIVGIYALLGAFLVNKIFMTGSEDQSPVSDTVSKICLIAVAVLFLSIVTALIFSAHKAKKSGQKLFDHTSKKMFWSMAIPLAAGGAFCLALLSHHYYLIVTSAMLLFYGLALLNSSKHSIPELRYLGLLQLLLGILAAFFPSHSLIFWVIGFGLLHIIYGAIMWNKYDRNK